ncbi:MULTISPECIES: protein-glutamate O-methyltransferase CheR [Actinosynnema]|uniref:CheR family methyltransferase n=1 Tax=Actinosynnema TaxID=40566 RepID=UPI0020A42AFB|nr:protein-glutamate O-methyltransferase CheR [Actinosynnema pretiosum]MCP2099502.1 chemotaxis protein methyltransferase CheR [Actinosynnema pretiosum]
MELNAQQFAFVADLVKREAAIVLAPGKEYLVESRLLPLARKSGHADTASLVQAVQSGKSPDLRQSLVEALTINETSWFRDQEPYLALKSVVLPAALESAGPARPLRFWSAACSSGQEPYSIAMKLEESLPPGRAYDITASDLSSEMVNRAQTGKYSQLEVNRGLPASLLVSHFDRAGLDWQVKPALRRNITFRRINLANPLPPMQPFDVIFLRNVLIYFDVETKRQILRRMRALMRPGGWLLLGSAETTMGIDSAFQRVPVGRTAVYRLAGGESDAATTSLKGVTTCAPS